ncbi:MAG: hypothetical protein RLZZ26_22 [Candidatus Parcubacteria bacterium]|jgi:hypothetical protein
MSHLQDEPTTGQFLGFVFLCVVGLLVHFAFAG